MTQEIQTVEELESKLSALGELNDTTKKSVVCALIGHSLIQETCFGYHYCGRCGEQVGDTLGGTYYDAPNTVIIGHVCETCRTNFEKLDWKHKYMCPDPFAVEEQTIENTK